MKLDFAGKIVLASFLGLLLACERHADDSKLTKELNTITRFSPVVNLNVVIDNVHFIIPSNYTSLVGTWDEKTKSYNDYASIIFDIKNLGPSTENTDGEIRVKVEPHRVTYKDNREELNMS